MADCLLASESGRTVAPDMVKPVRVQGKSDNKLENSGSSAIFLDHPMQRFFQDMMAARAHYANGLDKPGQNYGRVQFGEANQDFFI